MTERKQEIADYLERWKDCSAAEILEAMGKMRDFFLRTMTPAGKKFFLEKRGWDKL